MSTSRQIAPHKTVTRLAHTASRIERPIYKLNHTSPQAKTFNAISTSSSYSMVPEQRENNSHPTSYKKFRREVGNSGIIDNPISTENNYRSENLKKRSREVENASKYSTESTECSSVQKRSAESNFGTSNPKKRFSEVENPSRSSAKDSAENISRSAIPRKGSGEAENSNAFIMAQRSNNLHVSSTNKYARRVERSYNSTAQVSTNLRTANLKKPSTSVGNSSRSSAKDSTEDNSRSAVPRKGSGEVENSNALFMAQRSNNLRDPSTKRSYNSTAQVSLNTTNLRTANLKKPSTSVGNSSRNFTINNSVQRSGTGNNSHLANIRRHPRGAVCSTKREIVLGVGSGQFSNKALTTRIKNKDLNKDEWEEIRFIKAALINFVDGNRKYKKLKDGQLAWNKINTWAYSVFYPEFIKYLDEKLIKRDNVGLVIKTIMDYHISRKDRYKKILKKDVREKRISAWLRIQTPKI